MIAGIDLVASCLRRFTNDLKVHFEDKVNSNELIDPTKTNLISSEQPQSDRVESDIVQKGEQLSFPAHLEQQPNPFPVLPAQEQQQEDNSTAKHHQPSVMQHKQERQQRSNCAIIIGAIVFFVGLFSAGLALPQPRLLKYNDGSLRTTAITIGSIAVIFLAFVVSAWSQNNKQKSKKYGDSLTSTSSSLESGRSTLNTISSSLTSFDSSKSLPAYSNIRFAKC
ncbi:unnamed protein product [Didymodactylos carnosus]|uniref:Uncharacterized protein n=1 Tax=Didymodactylos carnosus TaxID=1234261 RepID=A0A814FI32_9BILA|nr:unnamed protein product [Didymodactylos carnosus]CAF0983140.1 unnamed protein product [Didymodactylos carnosus]CAF3725676.1 unnamed protein product [Didymodactylos carnosus]CAF3755574.1 unnamed protein product [Didymodactylos carnosus]